MLEKFFNKNKIEGGGNLKLILAILTMLAGADEAIAQSNQENNPNNEGQKKEALELIKEIKGDLKEFDNVVFTVEGGGGDQIYNKVDIDKDGELVLSQLSLFNGKQTVTYILDGGKDKDGKIQEADGVPDDFGIRKIKNKAIGGASQGINVDSELSKNNDVVWISGGNEKIRNLIGNNEKGTLEKEVGIKSGDLENLMRVYISELKNVRNAFNKQRIEKADKILKAKIKQEEEKQQNLNKFRENLR